MKQLLVLVLILLSAGFPAAGKDHFAKKTVFPKYDLTEEQLVQIARLCQQEQGSVDGAKAEASLMANQLETDASRRRKYGEGARGLWNWVRNGGWFYRAGYYMDNGALNETVLEGVRNVLVNGCRTLPLFVDEHDCLSDIKSVSTGRVSRKKDYIRGKTLVRNVYGSSWTFWCFPGKDSDPFGYTEEAVKAVRKMGGKVPADILGKKNAEKGAGVLSRADDILPGRP